MQNRLVLVVPCYNESMRLSALYFSDLQQELACDLFFVNDGSTDSTIEKISTFQFPLDILDLKKNVGKAKAIALGMAEVKDRYEWIGTCDADGAISIEDWKTALKIIMVEEDLIDCVSGARVLFAGMPLTRTLSRKWIGRIIATYVSLILNLQIYDPQSPCKIYSNTFLSGLNFDNFKTQWFLDAEMLLQKKMLSVKIKEFPLSNWRDIEGSHLRFSSVFEVIRDCVKLLVISIKSFSSRRV